MRSIGVRELRQQASRYLREVERGGAIEVTDRGRPVARLVPIPRSSRVDSLLATGEMSPAAADPLELVDPLAPLRGVPRRSVGLAALRPPRCFQPKTFAVSTQSTSRRRSVSAATYRFWSATTSGCWLLPAPSESGLRLLADSERKTGVKHAEVVTTRLVQDEGGWLRLAG